MCRVFFLYVLCVCCFADTYVLSNEETGIETVLPYNNWQLFKQETETSTTYIYSLNDNLSTRFAILIFHDDVYDNMKERSTEIGLTSLELYQEVSLSSEVLAEKAGERLIYSLGDSYVIEYGFKENNYFIIVQLATHISFWQTLELRKSWENVFIHFRWNEKLILTKDESSFQEIVKLRKSYTESSVEVLEHDVSVSFTDDFVLIEDKMILHTKEEIKQIELYTSLSNIKKVNVVNKKYDLQWYLRDSNIHGVSKVYLDFAYSLPEKEDIAIIFVAQIPKVNGFFCTNYYYPNVFGSETLYKFHFAFPEKCSFHISSILSETSNNHYQQKITSKNLVAIGFAVGNFTETIKQIGDMEVKIIHSDDVTNENVNVVVKVIELIAEVFGVNPFKNGCLVLLKSKELVATNSPYFLTFAYDWEQPYDWNHIVEDTFLHDVIVVLAKIWMPEMSLELQESLAEYCRLCVIEKMSSLNGYYRAIGYLKEDYRKNISTGEEFAIAHPANWKNLGVVKSKGPLTFAYLRNKIGREKFQDICGEVLQKKNSSYKSIAEVCLQKTKINISKDLKKWFFQTGYPDIRVTWKQKDIHTHVYLQQQKSIYTISGNLVITTDKKLHKLPITIDGKLDHFMIVVPEKINKIEFLWE